MERHTNLVSITTMLIVVWHLSILLASVCGECKQTGACSCESSDGVIDLSPLGLKDDARFKDIAGESTFLFYSWNPCFPFSEGPTGAALCQNVATCLIVKSSSVVSTYYAIGTQPSAKFVTTGAKIQINYNFTQGSYTLLSVVHLECDESLDPGILTIPATLNSGNNMYYKGRYACYRSIAGTGGISPGSVILIIVFVVVCLYLILGISFQKFYRKESGRQIIPNSNVWFSLPGLIKGGFLSIVQCFKGRGTKYDNI